MREIWKSYFDLCGKQLYVFVLFLLSVHYSHGDSCNFNIAGTITATYCEHGCCESSCCGKTSSEDDSRTPSIVLGALAAVVLVCVVVVVVICCCKHRCHGCQQRNKQNIVDIPMSESVSSNTTANRDTSTPISDEFTLSREETFTISPLA